MWQRQRILGRASPPVPSKQSPTPLLVCSLANGGDLPKRIVLIRPFRECPHSFNNVVNFIGVSIFLPAAAASF